MVKVAEISELFRGRQFAKSIAYPCGLEFRTAILSSSIQLSGRYLGQLCRLQLDDLLGSCRA